MAARKTAPALLRAQGLSKRFYETLALDNVSFDLNEGEIHAVVGENGAGKSTLIKIFSGVHEADHGAFSLAGETLSFASPGEAASAGIVAIPQEMRVALNLTVAESVLMGLWPKRKALGLFSVIDRKRMHEEAREALARLKFSPDLNMPLAELSYAERQLVVIARALSLDARVLILDEPTASLEHREVERLFDVLAHLKKQHTGIIYISHRLDEVTRLADRCTVMRDGKVVKVFRKGKFKVADLIKHMAGRDLEELHRPHKKDFGAELFHLSGDEGHETEQHVAVREGQVVGLTGLLGAGTTALLRRAYGAELETVHMTRRERWVNVRNPRDAIRLGFGFVPAERRIGVILDATVRENILLPNLHIFGRIRGIDNQALDAFIDFVMETVDIRPRDPHKLMRYLSGGNQQKVMFARWLAGNIHILLLDEPTHGIDVGAKAIIHRLMREFTEKGGGVLFSSTEMHEVLNISDEVLAMHRGKIVKRMARGRGYTEKALREAIGA